MYKRVRMPLMARTAVPTVLTANVCARLLFGNGERDVVSVNLRLEVDHSAA